MQVKKKEKKQEYAQWHSIWLRAAARLCNTLFTDNNNKRRHLMNNSVSHLVLYQCLVRHHQSSLKKLNYAFSKLPRHNKSSNRTWHLQLANLHVHTSQSIKANSVTGFGNLQVVGIALWLTFTFYANVKMRAHGPRTTQYRRALTRPLCWSSSSNTWR